MKKKDSDSLKNQGAHLQSFSFSFIIISFRFNLFLVPHPPLPIVLLSTVLVYYQLLLIGFVFYCLLILMIYWNTII